MDSLINLFSLQPRRYRVVEGTVKGRQTVATLFWAQQYRIQGWFGYRRYLRREQFDQLLAKWEQAGLVVCDSVAKTVRLTTQGEQKRQQYRQTHYLPRCGDLAWLTNPHHLAERLLLGIQTVSELSYHHQRYVPLDVSMADMTAVKRWFYRYRSKLVQQVRMECFHLADALDKIDQRWALFFVYSLAGYQTSGLYSAQFQDVLSLSQESLQLLSRDVWLMVAQLLVKNDDWLLTKLTRQLLRKSPLNSSAEKTLQLYLAGMDIDTISKTRQLKITTIREHLLAAAIVLPGSVDAVNLVGKERWQQLSRRYHGPVSKWQWTPVDGEDAAQSFFAFRLYQIERSRQDERARSPHHS